MRVTSPLPRMTAPAPSGDPAAAPPGEFRAALRSADADPDADNATAPAAAQAAALAEGAGARPDRASGSSSGAPGVGDPGDSRGAGAQRIVRHARTTPPATGAAAKAPGTPDSIADAVDAFTAGALGARGARFAGLGGGGAASGDTGEATATGAPHAAGDDRATTPPHFPEAGAGAGIDAATAAMLHAAYGIVVGAPANADAAATAKPAAASSTGRPGAAGATQGTRAASGAGDSPVAVWTAAAVSRAIGSIGPIGPIGTTGSTSPEGANGPKGPGVGFGAAALRAGQAGLAGAAAATPGNANAADPANAAGAAATPGAGAGSPAFALTPLEQAVHELVGRMGSAEPGHGRATHSLADDAAVDASRGVAGAGDTGGLASMGGMGLSGVAAPLAQAPAHAGSAATAAGQAPAMAQLPEPPANPSHIHLVIDDGPERVVATVAVRGNEVHVALRATDDTTAAALARNAASLDHAMTRRGLALHDMSAEREPRDQRPSQDAEPRERRPRDDQRFELEETP